MNHVAVFKGTSGLNETFFALTSSPGRDFLSEISCLMDSYSELMCEYGCDSGTEVFLRFHLSDIYNQMPLFSEVVSERDCYMSCIGQPPANGSRVALEAWHFDQDSKCIKSVKSSSTEFNVDLTNYKLLYHCGAVESATGSYNQTAELFQSLNSCLKKHDGNLTENCIRTWLYCRDIDNNYGGLVDARKELFGEAGMNQDTHYITSTGIEGQREEVSQLVHMDSCSLLGHKQKQIEFMHAPEHMSPTSHYGVTFERGTRVVFGDRSHYYISGTASIDNKGNILHHGDIVRQTRRMMDNVSALMENHNGSLDDLKIAMVYVRDFADTEAVKTELNDLLPDSVPRIIVKAPVCRPGWLVEIDAMGVNTNGKPEFKNFC